MWRGAVRRWRGGRKQRWAISMLMILLIGTLLAWLSAAAAAVHADLRITASPAVSWPSWAPELREASHGVEGRGPGVVYESVYAASSQLAGAGVYRCGWPLPAFEWRFVGDKAGVQPLPGVSGGLEWPPGRNGLVRRLPVRPVFPEAALLVLFWSTSCGAVWILVPACGRRSIALLRARRGRCARCGYDLAGLGGAASPGACPECGTGR